MCDDIYNWDTRTMFLSLTRPPPPTIEDLVKRLQAAVTTVDANTLRGAREIAAWRLGTHGIVAMGANGLLV
jgi:hypothetical protein